MPPWRRTWPSPGPSPTPTRAREVLLQQGVLHRLQGDRLVLVRVQEAIAAMRLLDASHRRGAPTAVQGASAAGPRAPAFRTPANRLHTAGHGLRATLTRNPLKAATGTAGVQGVRARPKAKHGARRGVGGSWAPRTYGRVPAGGTWNAMLMFTQGECSCNATSTRRTMLMSMQGGMCAGRCSGPPFPKTLGRRPPGAWPSHPVP